MRGRSLVLALALFLAIFSVAGCSDEDSGSSGGNVKGAPTEYEVQTLLNNYQNTYGIPPEHPWWAQPFSWANLMSATKCELLQSHKNQGITELWGVELLWITTDETLEHTAYWYVYKQGDDVWRLGGSGSPCREG